MPVSDWLTQVHQEGGPDNEEVAAQLGIKRTKNKSGKVRLRKTKPEDLLPLAAISKYVHTLRQLRSYTCVDLSGSSSSNSTKHYSDKR